MRVRSLLLLVLTAVASFAQIFSGDPGATRKPDRTIPDAAEGPVTRVGFANDGNILTASDGGNTTAWDVKSGKRVAVVPPAFNVPDHRALVVSATSLDGAQSASASGNQIKIWDATTGGLLSILLGHTGEVLSLAFSPNGRTIASGGADRTVRLWTMPLPPIPPEDLKKIEAAIPSKASVKPKKPRRLLVFWRADAIQHKAGVPAANKMIELLARQTGLFQVDFSRDYDVLDPKILANYDAILMNSTAHLAIPGEAKEKAFLDYVRGGGGVVGIHAAIDTFKDWSAGAEVIGATFGGHPFIPTGNWAVKIEEPDHPLTRAFAGKGFIVNDEIYEMDEPYTRANRRVLLSLDLADPATGAITRNEPPKERIHRADKDFAVSWVKRFGAGKVFYAVFGHVAAPFQNPAIVRFYLDGIQYALGDLEVDDTPRR